MITNHQFQLGGGRVSGDIDNDPEGTTIHIMYVTRTPIHCLNLDFIGESLSLMLEKLVQKGTL